MVPENSPGISRVPGYSGAALIDMQVSPTGLSPSTTELSSSFGYLHTNRYWRSYNPDDALPHHRFGLFRVRSPLLTESLFIFSSCGYLDVSVHRVGSLYQCVTVAPLRVPPFGHLRVVAHLPLAATFRSLSRPSSPPRAKASAVCSYLLFFYLYCSRSKFSLLASSMSMYSCGE